MSQLFCPAVDGYVIAGSLHPINLVAAGKYHAATGANYQPVGSSRVRAQLKRVESVGDPARDVEIALRVDGFARPLNGGVKALVVDGLQQPFHHLQLCGADIHPVEPCHHE